MGWALRCRLPPMRKVALTIKAHLRGILEEVRTDAPGFERELAEAQRVALQRKLEKVTLMGQHGGRQVAASGNGR